jgi:HAAS domain-containing protein
MSDDGTAQGGAPTVHLASAPAEEYLGGVRTALADLPAPEVAEILDDVRAHLADLTAELGGEADVAALTARLGPPSAYAAELRAAAGYPAAEPKETGRSRHGLARLAVAAPVAGGLLFLLGAGAGEPTFVFVGLLIGALGLPLVIRDGPHVPSVAALPEMRWLAARPAAGTSARTVADFVASLQPAWWVVRAIAAAALVVAVFSGGGAPAVLLLALFAVPVSIWVGHRTRRDRRWLWGVVPLNALAALVLLWMLADGLPGSYDSGPAPSYPVSMSGLWQDSEREIRDIRPVDADGNPLTGVYLFDQDGLPIDTSSGADCTGPGRDEPGSSAAYPRGTWDYDSRTGRCRHTPPGPLVVAVPTTPAPGAGAETALPTPGPTPELVPPPPIVSAPPATPLTTPPVVTPAAPPTR